MASVERSAWLKASLREAVKIGARLPSDTFEVGLYEVSASRSSGTFVCVIANRENDTEGNKKNVGDGIVNEVRLQTKRHVEDRTGSGGDVSSPCSIFCTQGTIWYTVCTSIKN